MKTPLRNIRYLLILPALLAATDCLADRMYKWVDANGQVHYSNRLPPEASKQERKVINEQGRTLKVYRAPRTPEEKAEEQRLAELEAQKEKILEQRRIHDRSLLATYSSQEDMLLARDGKLSSVEALIQLTNSRITSMQERLLVLSDEAAEYERSGKQLPLSLQQQITNLRQQITKNREFAADKQLEMEDIRKQFDADMKRYNELTDETPAATTQKEQLAALESLKKNPEIKLDRRDQTLLASYASEADLLFDRDQQISKITTLINDTRQRLGTMQEQLSALSDTADEYQGRDKKIPDQLLQQMKDAIAEITRTESLLQELRSEKQAVEKKFTANIARYQELLASQ
jgi:chromosome segregation ATPase